MADHRNLVSAEVHEPKHISDSTSADSGKVITPLSGGASELRNLVPSEVGIHYAYAEAGVSENTGTISTTAASDPNLYDPSDYTNITSANLPGATVDEQYNMDFDNIYYEFEIPFDGVYKTEFWANVLTDTNNTKVGLRFTNNGIPTSNVVKHDIPTLDRVANISSTSIATLSAGDKVGMAVATDKSVNATIADMKVTLILVREL